MPSAHRFSYVFVSLDLGIRTSYFRTPTPRPRLTINMIVSTALRQRGVQM